jgi:hypothetical protein
VKRSVSVPVDVPPTGMLPTDVTVTDASAGAAMAAVKREARSAALVPMLSAFFQIVK